MKCAVKMDNVQVCMIETQEFLNVRRFQQHYCNEFKFSGQTGLGTQCRPRSDCSDQSLHCLQFPLHILDSLHYGKGTLFEF